MSGSLATLQSALAHHQAGHWAEAEQGYRDVLASDPQNADAHHLLGLIALERGRAEAAIQHLQAAIALNPAPADFHRHLAAAYLAAGRQLEALECYRVAVVRAPDSAASHNDLGNALGALGRWAEAEASYRQGLLLDPGLAELHSNLGGALQGQGRMAEALEAFGEAVRLRPDLAEAHFNLGNGHRLQNQLPQAIDCFRRALAIKPEFVQAQCSLGAALQASGQFLPASESFRAALRLKPDYGEAINGLGAALQMQGLLAEAQNVYERALKLDPADATAQFNLGTVLEAQRRYGQAQAAYERYAALRPGLPESHHFLGKCLQWQGKLPQAIAAHTRAIELRPGYVDAHYYRGLAQLAAGDFAAGWPDFEWRLNYSRRTFAEPRWDGGDLRGRSILVYVEEGIGLGDVMQFVRYVPLVADRGGDVFVEAQRSLIPLLQQSGFRQLIVAGAVERPSVDVQVPLLSLPGIFGTTLESILSRVPYFAVDRHHVEQWADRLRSHEGFRIGIHWRGSDWSVADRRSIPLEHFEALANVPTVELFSLQKESGIDEIASLTERFNVVDFGATLDQSGAFLDTAAMMKCLDLVVTCDTAIAHLAGALNVPVWVGLSTVSDFRWMLDRHDSPWYPSMRLFRQSAIDDWTDVFAAMAEELSRQIGKRD